MLTFARLPSRALAFGGDCTCPRGRYVRARSFARRPRSRSASRGLRAGLLTFARRPCSRRRLEVCERGARDADVRAAALEGTGVRGDCRAHAGAAARALLVGRCRSYGAPTRGGVPRLASETADVRAAGARGGVSRFASGTADVRAARALDGVARLRVRDAGARGRGRRGVQPMIGLTTALPSLTTTWKSMSLPAYCFLSLDSVSRRLAPRASLEILPG